MTSFCNDTKEYNCFLDVIIQSQPPTSVTAEVELCSIPGKLQPCTYHAIQQPSLGGSSGILGNDPEMLSCLHLH